MDPEFKVLLNWLMNLFLWIGRCAGIALRSIVRSKELFNHSLI